MEELTTLAKLHNRALSKVLLKLESQLKGFKYSLADFYSFFIERINSPSKYGMSLSLAFIAHNVFYYCCTQYFSFIIDNQHHCFNYVWKVLRKGRLHVSEVVHIGEFQVVEEDPMSTNHVRKLVTFCFLTLFILPKRPTNSFAELIWSGIPNITGPYKLKALFEQ